MTSNDRSLLTELVRPYIDIIECKESGLRTMMAKKKAWKAIANQYNTTASSDRDEKQLKKAWDNQKMSAKKAKAEQRREMRKTGGGPLPAAAEVSDADNKVLSLLGDKIDSLINSYDDDAEINDEEEDQGQHQATQSTSAQAIAEVSKKPLTKSEIFMDYERQEHELRMEYWRLKIQFLKEEHEEKLKKLRTQTQSGI